MGSVKVDLMGKERFYKDLFLSDIDVLQLLIEYRFKYDKYLGNQSNNMFTEAGEITDVNPEIIATYASIDVLIDQCGFDENQLKIIEMIGQEYTIKEIAEELGLKHEDNIRQRFNKILRDIAKVNERNWRKIVYINKMDLRAKNCSKCKESLPATPEFFRDHSVTKDGFQSRCKECEK